MADVGGVAVIVIVAVASAVSSLAKYSFIMYSAEKLFYGRTKSNNIFLPKVDKRA